MTDASASYISTWLIRSAPATTTGQQFLAVALVARSSRDAPARNPESN